MVEEPLKMKKKDQISFDEQEALRLQAEFNKEDRLVREKAQQFQQLLEKKENFYSLKRAEEKRNRRPTRSQQRSIMYMDTELVEGSEVRAEGSETREESSSKRAGDEL
ncbi:hypothetical protein Tco_1066419 [Tanacetum coccineum]|uniref:Uncharacterized protein n=1 Tax=Tanacetum coccineum TaxID=301880 RepID=A0ABQ5HBQ5_9ASTR